MKHNYHPSIKMIEIIAAGLGKLREEIVFVGGATVPLHLNDPASPEARPTEDVDCIVEITSQQRFSA